MHTGLPDYATIERVEGTLHWIEAFECDTWLERLDGQSIEIRGQAQNWFKGWLRGLSSLSRARLNGHMSMEQMRRFQELLHRRGACVYAVQERGLRVRAVVFEAARLCA